MTNKLSKSDFNKIYNIMQNSFPKTECRTFDEQEKLLSNENYKITYLKEDNKITCFIAYWEFDSFIFIEHFAVAPEKRNCGIGSDFLKTFLSLCYKKVVLEVELPLDDIARRRIDFYQKIGFIKNNYPYIQPSMRKDALPVPLEIMSYNSALEKNEFHYIKDTLYTSVYNAKDVF